MSYDQVSMPVLINSLQNNTSVFIKQSSTGVIILCAYGARVIGMYPDGNEQNALWVNPKIESTIRAGQPNLGGDKIWIIPKSKFFYENPRDLEGFHIPFEIDPGEYRGYELENTIVFENSFPLFDYVNNHVYEETLVKRTIQSINDPFYSSLHFVGVSITDQITVFDKGLSISTSSKTRVFTKGFKYPGTALIPINPFFSSTVSEEYLLQNHLSALIKIDGMHSQIVFIKPEHAAKHTNFNVIYISPFQQSDSRWFCVIKQAKSNAFPSDSQECVDQHYANICSVYNSSNEEEYTSFGEMEFNFKKASTINNTVQSINTHYLLTYCGTKTELLELITTILSLPEKPVIY